MARDDDDEDDVPEFDPDAGDDDEESEDEEEDDDASALADAAAEEPAPEPEGDLADLPRGNGGGGTRGARVADLLAPKGPLVLRADLPKLDRGTMLVALSGWMDGGSVSTGTVRHLMARRPLVACASVRPGGFYIDNFPGSMDVAAVFRPAVKYENGVVRRLDMPTNVVRADASDNLAFFLGKEPNLDWPKFADCVFAIAERLNVGRLVFVGSFGGTVPHTREPRLFGSVSEDRLAPLMRQNNLTPSEYEGPASFASYLLWRAPKHGVEMLSIAAEIPGYLQGPNPRSIEAVARRLVNLLGRGAVDLAVLREASTEWELKVSEAVEKDDDLAKRVRQLEEAYDDELIQATGLD